MCRTEKPAEGQVYLGLLLSLLWDITANLQLGTSATIKDGSTIIARFESEGESFLTKALPSLGKSLDKALSRDVPLTCPPGFNISRKTGLPVLFGALWQRIFTSTGQLRITDEGFPSPETVNAVRAVRQLCFLAYKLEGAHSKESEAAVLDSFVATDAELPGAEDDLSLDPYVTRAIDIARCLIWKVLRSVDLQDITPRHGPGAVATGERGREKFRFRRIYRSLEGMYPFADYMFFNYSHWVDDCESGDVVELPHSTAKVVLVPKDSRGPRIISEEPLEIQWIQQGQRLKLYHAIETHPLTSGFVNFRDQSVNQALALQNSKDGEFATLDMKDASDRVSLWLVRKLFPGHILPYLEASRSRATVLPDGRTVELKKFAPMGSSVCFPVEALIFWALAVGAIEAKTGWGSLKNPEPVYVYGDDLVLRKEHWEWVQEVFAAVKLKFNEDKCAVGRFFRESCGLDAFYGCSITPTRLRTRWAARMSPATLAAWVALYNALSRGGYTHASTFVEGACSEQFGKLPRIRAADLVVLALVKPGWTNTEVCSDLLTRFKVRYNSALQKYEVRLLQPRSPLIKCGDPDWAELLRAHIYGGPPDPLGLLSSGRLAPCRYPLLRADSMQWAWVEVQPLIQ